MNGTRSATVWGWLRADENLRIAAVGAILLISAIVVALLVANAREQRQTATALERHTYRVLIQTDKLQAALQTAETANRGYLLTGGSNFLASFNDSMKAVPQELNRLREMTIDNPAQQANIGRLTFTVGERLASLRRGVELTGAGEAETAIDIVRSGRGTALMQEALGILQEINRIEDILLQQRSEESNATLRQTDMLIGILLILMVVLIFFGLRALVMATRLKYRTAALEVERELAQKLREADEAAIRAAATVAAIGDALPDLVFAKDREGRLTYANASTAAVIGLPVDDLIGKLTVEFSDDTEEARIIDANDRDVMDGGAVQVSDEQFSGPDGVHRLFRSTKAPLRDGEGNVIGLAGVAVDVTAERNAVAALKASEERFRSLSETLPAFIFMTNDKGEVTYSNNAFQQYTGKSNDDLMGMGWVRTVHRDDWHVPEKAWQRAAETGQPFHAEYRFRRHDDEYRWFLVRATPLPDASGTVSQWIGTCSDMQDAVDVRTAIEALNEGLEEKVAERTAELKTAIDTLQMEVAEREKAEAQVRQMQKIESIGQLTGGIAHDFNNMLAVVLGSLEIVKRRLKTDPDRALAGIENAEEGARRAALLTSRLLAFSRQQPLAPEAVNANRLVSGMSELLRQTIGEQIEIETVLAGGLWKTHIDAPQLENAILNLCVNARDAMLAKDEGGGKLTIETHNCHLDEGYAASNVDAIAGQYVLVSVSDTGTGMTPAIIDRAFDPFYTTKEVGKGTGLGLSQVYGFVKQSGGHIKIYSEPDEGTTVKLYLPRYFGEAESEAKTMAASGDMPVAIPGETILVVEDEAQVRQVSTELLRDLGYEVIEAVNGADALEKLRGAGRIDLIFTDIVMPGMTGRMMADEAAKQRAGIKVLYTTGYTRNAVVHNGKLDPGTEFIAKPYAGAALAVKVRSVLDKD